MFTWIANTIRSMWRDPSHTNVEQSDRTSVSQLLPEREDIVVGPASSPRLRNPSGSDHGRQVVFFVPDITQSCSETWKTDASEFWPNETLKDFHKVTFDYSSSFATSLGKLLSYDIIRMIALRLLSEMQNKVNEIKRKDADALSLVIVAHGYGGLISEQAYLFSLMAPAWHGLVKIQGIILFGTPHFLAGLAQWALISAKKLGIECEDNPQQQNWSEEKVDEDVRCIAEMQKAFRDLDTELKMACYFSLLPDTQSKLEISPQWAILPGVKAVALNTDHFGMTKVHEPTAQKIEELPSRLSREALERCWIQSSQKHHGQGPSQISTKPPHVKRDKIFSPQPNKGQEASRKNTEQISWPSRSKMRSAQFSRRMKDEFERMHGHGTYSLCFRLAGQIYARARANDTAGLELEQMIDTNLIDAMFDYSLGIDVSYGRVDVLRVLFVLRGDKITISDRHLSWVATVGRSKKDLAMLELVLLLRGDQFSTTDIARTCMDASKAKNGVAAIELLLDRFAEQMSAADIASALSAAAVCKRPRRGANINTTSGDIFPLLLKWGDRISVPEMVNVFTAAVASKTHSMAIIQMFLDRYGEMVIPSIQYAVEAAATNAEGGAAVMELLFSRYGDRIELTEELFRFAAGNHSTEMRLRVSLILLRAATNRNADYSRCIELLVRTPFRRPLDERFSWEMFSFAAEAEEFGVCRLLLDSGLIDSDFRDYEDGSWTPLLYAIYKEGSRLTGAHVVRVLVDTGHIDKNKVEDERKGQKALSYAAQLGLSDSVKHLLRIKDIRVDSRDEWDQTPLFFAATSEGDQEVVDILLDTHEVDVNARNYKGETPLFWAVREGKEKAVESLLKKGKADVNIENHDNETPYSLAKIRKNDRIIELLCEEGALDSLSLSL